MPGLFILSLDTEIAWGTYGAAALARKRAHFDGYRDTVRRLLALLDAYQAPATWAVIGHLLLERCDGHPDVLQPHYAWSPVPDSERDPCSDVDAAPWYYGPDVVAMIRSARVAHEIGTHTFTHAIAGDPAVTPAIWESQLAKCAAVHADQGLPMRSLVHPREQVAYTEHLSKYGIIAYRGGARRWHRRRRDIWGRVGHLVDAAVAFPPPTYDPATLRVGAHLVDLPASQILLPYDGVRRWIPTASRVRQARLGLNRAVRRGRLYHLWLHPFNLGGDDAMFDALTRILADVAQRREHGQLRVMTMGGAAEWILRGMPDV